MRSELHGTITGAASDASLASRAASLDASASATEASPASTGAAASLPLGIDEVQVATPLDTRQVYPGEQPQVPQSPRWHVES
jgi:hypothetical protein